jgi:hypothetical protein
MDQLTNLIGMIQSNSQNGTNEMDIDAIFSNPEFTKLLNGKQSDKVINYLNSLLSTKSSNNDDKREVLRQKLKQKKDLRNRKNNKEDELEKLKKNLKKTFDNKNNTNQTSIDLMNENLSVADKKKIKTLNKKYGDIKVEDYTNYQTIIKKTPSNLSEHEINHYKNLVKLYQYQQHKNKTISSGTSIQDATKKELTLNVDDIDFSDSDTEEIKLR